MLESLVILPVMSLMRHLGTCFAVTRIAMLILRFKRCSKTHAVRTVSYRDVFFHPFQSECELNSKLQ